MDFFQFMSNNQTLALCLAIVAYLTVVRVLDFFAGKRAKPSSPAAQSDVGKAEGTQ